MRVKKKRVALLLVFVGLFVPAVLFFQMWNSHLMKSNFHKTKDYRSVDLRRVLNKKADKVNTDRDSITTIAKAEEKIIFDSLEESKKQVTQASDEEKRNNIIQTRTAVYNYTKEQINLRGGSTGYNLRANESQRKSDIDSKGTIAVSETTSRKLKTSEVDSTWQIWNSMAKARYLTPIGERDDNLTAVLKAMETAEIVSADIGYGGTALKVSLILDGEQEVVFRPMRYPRDKIIEGTPIAGHDRHNGEIAAFHIDRILGFNRAPPVVGRKIDLLQEIEPNGEFDLMKTFFKKGNNTCFYGVCHLCRKETAACANGTVIEGSLTLWLPPDWRLRKARCPWQRTTRTGLTSLLEVDNYCPVINKLPRTTLLDIVDTAVFDFLIGNADRHHYEWLANEQKIGMILHLDNAKSIRSSTWQRLVKINANKRQPLSDLVRTSLKSDPLFPVLADGHFDALNRRLGIVVDMINTCIQKSGKDRVVLDDGL